MAEPFSFSKEARHKDTSARLADAHSFGNLLFDVEEDPGQTKPVDDLEIETMMTRLSDSRLQLS
ncbi:MAG: hypothetical protein OXG78_15860 [Chloroflexi bacterium]|nr:hypothetical protein [Chloroflexota bacterium]